MVLLVTAGQLASHLQVPEVDTLSAEQAIATCSAYVETKTGLAFTPRTATIRLPSSGGLELHFPLRPVRAVTAASIDGVPVTDFQLTAAGTIYRARSWRTAYAPQTLLLTVDYGMASTPADIQGVVLELAGGIYDGRLGVEAEQIDDYRVSYSGVLSETSRAILAAYGADVAALSMTGR